MQQPPVIFDRAAVERHRRRRTEPDAMFLHALAADEIKERRDLVNRAFRDIAVVTGHPEFWRGAMSDAQIVRDEEALALTPGSCDLVVHAMALHLANDPLGQIIQCRRALRPDGLFLAVLPGGRTLSELRAAISQAEVEHSGGLSPRVAPMAEIRDLGGLLQRAGLALPVADSTLHRVSYGSMHDLMRDLRSMGETNPMAGRSKNFTAADLMRRAARIYAENFTGSDGRLEASFELIYLAGWAPAASQPRPLRPGSAAARLAEALETTEYDENARPVPGNSKS